MATHVIYRIEELDKRSLDYLRLVNEHKGRGMPGIYVAKSNYLPLISFFFGIFILGATAFVAFPPVHEPLAEAMLQTAGFLLGGWCVVASLRMWIASSRQKTIGSFLYVDAENLWQCDPSEVRVTDIQDLIQATAVHKYNKEEQYECTEIVMEFERGKSKVKVKDRDKAEAVAHFMNVLDELRRPIQDDDGSKEYRSSALIGGIAAEWARGDDVAPTITIDRLDLEVTAIPMPKRTGKASSGIFHCLIIVGFAILGIVFFRSVNREWRDDTIFDRIQEIRHIPGRAPWLRAYLADDRNVRHRAEAQRMLDRIYDDALLRMRTSGDGAGGAVDPQMHAAFADLVNSLKSNKQPVISVDVKELGNLDGAQARQDQVHNLVFSQFEHAIGAELICFLKAPEGIPGLVEYNWKFDPQVPGGVSTIVWTISFRKYPDDKPVTFERKTQHNFGLNFMAQVNEGAQKITRSIVGSSEAPKPPPDDDF